MKLWTWWIQFKWKGRGFHWALTSIVITFYLTFQNKNKMQIQLYSNKSKTNNHTYLYMFRNQVDITVQFSKMMISYLKIFLFTVFKFKTMVGQVYHGPFLCFSDEFQFFYQHTQCLGCAFIIQRALQVLFSILSVRENPKL